MKGGRGKRKSDNKLALDLVTLIRDQLLPLCPACITEDIILDRMIRNVRVAIAEANLSTVAARTEV